MNAAALAALLASCSFSSGQTFAQDAAPAEPIEKVLVTAQKRGVEENAQTVPISLSVIGSARIEDLHARDLSDLTTAAPNVTFTDAGTLPGFANFTIRGLGINTTIPSIEPAVGVFVDGIYLGMSAGAVLDLFDVEDVEILRGPQATLFGRNTTGGAVLINTRKPGDVFAMRGMARIESGLQETVGFSIETPLGGGFRAKLTGYYDNDSGWFTNRFDGSSFGAQHTSFTRPMLVWKPDANLDSTLIYERGATRGQGPVAQNPEYVQGFEININNPGYHKTDWEALTSETNWHAGQAIITNLFGYRRYDEQASADIDAQPTTRFHAFDVLDQDQYSDELRASGQFFDRLDVTAGLYYFTQRFLYLERRLLAGGAIDSTLGGKMHVENYAAFAQTDYHVTPEWTLIAGGRFTGDEKSAQIATFVPVTAGSRCSFANESCAYNFPGVAFPGSPGQKRWENFTPKLGVTWRPEDNMFLYATWTRGVRSGGYNVRSTSFVVPPGPYDPELQDAYEIGLKSDWFDDRLRANGALFYDTVKNMQRDINLTDPIVGVVQLTRNTANATLQGAEIEITGALTDEFVLNANAGYTDGRYDKIFFDLDGGGIGASDLGLSIPRLSKWGYSFGARYTHSVAGFLVQLSADYGYRSRAPYTDSNSTYLAPIESLAASASVTLPDRHWSLSVYGRNLLDRVTDGVVSPLPANLGGGAFRTLNEGRVVGVEVRFNY